MVWDMAVCKYVMNCSFNTTIHWQFCLNHGKDPTICQIDYIRQKIVHGQVSVKISNYSSDSPILHGRDIIEINSAVHCNAHTKENNVDGNYFNPYSVMTKDIRSMSRSGVTYSLS